MRAHIYILTNNDKKIIAVYIYKLYNIVNYVVFLQFDDNFCIFILFYITRWKHPNGRGYVVFFLFCRRKTLCRSVSYGLSSSFDYANV